MPYYDYECAKCGHETQIIKKISEYDRQENCPNCTEEMQRLISPGYFIGEKVQEAYFNHGLGCVVKNNKHKDEIAKQRGLIEVGNDKPKDEIKHNPYEI